MKKIGVIGCGLMGKGMITNLLQKSYDVTIFDVNEQAMIPLVEKGATSAKSIASLASKVDLVLLSLPSPKIIEHILIEEAFPAMKQGTYILDMSTNDVELTRKLASEAKKLQITLFDCPVSGGPKGADAGTLTIMVGGDEAKYPMIAPVLEVIGENINYIGDDGAGQIVKLCNNMLVGGIISLASEVLKTGEKLGVNKKKIAEVMQNGSAQNKVMDVFGPSILSEDSDEVTFSLANMLKDIRLYEEMATNAGITSDVSKSVQQLYELAEEAEMGSQDATAVFEVVK